MEAIKKKKDFKTIKVSYNIGAHDLETKKRHITKFLDKGLKVKVEMRIRGRERYLYKNAAEHLIEMFSEYKVINSWSNKDNYYLYITHK